MKLPHVKADIPSQPSQPSGTLPATVGLHIRLVETHVHLKSLAKQKIVHYKVSLELFWFW